MNLEDALTQSISKMVGKKNGVAVVGMSFIYAMKDQPWQTMALLTAIVVSTVFFQWVLDMYEVKKTGRDQPENGNGVADLPNDQTPSPTGVPQ